MDTLALLIDLHGDGDRQGPGGDEQTALAVALSGLGGKPNLHIADIGCGTGASTLMLAKTLDAHVLAVDFVPEFLDKLRISATRHGLNEKIETLEASMDELPLKPQSLDAIWSEGAIYNMGFESGIQAWRPFLKTGAILAVSELTWLTEQRPAELTDHWHREYPEVATAAEKMKILEMNGFSPLGYFALPTQCWLENYYRPLDARFDAFLERHDHSEQARELVAAEQQEIALYERYCEFFSYGYYIAKKV